MEKLFNYTITDKEIFENIFTDEKLLMNHVVVPAGKVFPKHPTDAVVYALITKGTLSLRIEDGEVSEYNVGQLVNIPKGIVSELGNRSNDILEMFIVKYDFDK